MPGSVSAQEARGAPTIPASADFAVCVVGRTTLNPIGAGPGPVSSPYSDAATLAAAWGLGDAVDCATQAIVPTPGNPAPPPVCILQTPATTPGVRGTTLDTSGVTGTAVITKTSGTHPTGTFQPVVRVSDDGNSGAGGLIGTAGIYLECSPDNGRTWLPSQALGTAFSISMLIGGLNTGVQYDIAPSTTNANYVTLAVELRADCLAHLANVTAHDAADTSAAQVALAASSVPATVTASTAVVNLVLTTMVEHVRSLTSHDGPDLPAATALAALSAATNTKTGIDLAIALKGILNTHEGATFISAGAGLKAATATVAAPVTVLAAAMLSGGITALDAEPRRLIFTTAGGTAADAPATVAISGFDLDGAAQTETLSLAQTATFVISAKAWKGTGLQLDYATADGTGATIAVGYSNGVHNSADATNLITSADPTYGTLKTGDTWSESKTTPPMWAVADLYTAGSPATGAFADIAASSTPFAIVVLTEPVAVGDVPTLTAALNYLATFNKRPALLCRFRDRLVSGETDAQYVAAFQTFRAAIAGDSRIGMVVGSGWLTDAFRGYRYLRSGLPALLARMQSFAVVPGARKERMAQNPGWVARGVLEGFSLVDDTGTLLPEAHDERTLGGIDGPLNGLGGGITFYHERSDAVSGTYVSQACPVLYQSGEQVFTWMDRRVLSGIELVTVTSAITELGGADVFAGLTLDADIVDGLNAKFGKLIRDRYSNEFQNAADMNLVSVSPTITLNNERVGLSTSVRPRLYGYTYTIALTIFAAR